MSQLPPCSRGGTVRAAVQLQDPIVEVLVQDVNHKDVARLGTIHPDRPTEYVNNLKIDIGDVLGIVVVFDLAVGPVFAFDAEDIAWVNGCNSWNVRMPAVMTGHLLLIHRFRQINLEQGLWHCAEALATLNQTSAAMG